MIFLINLYVWSYVIFMLPGDGKKMPNLSSDLPRTLIIQLARLGDLLQSLPVLSSLLEKFPDRFGTEGLHWFVGQRRWLALICTLALCLSGLLSFRDYFWRWPQDAGFEPVFLMSAFDQGDDLPHIKAFLRRSGDHLRP